MLPSEFVAKVTEAGLKWEKISDHGDFGIRIFVGKERHRVMIEAISGKPEGELQSLIDSFKAQVKLYQDFDTIPDKG